MDRLYGKFNLSGDFHGHRDANVNFWFRFCDDGIYYYKVEQTGVWRFAHRGRFEIRSIKNPRGGEHDCQVIRLEPLIIDLQPKDRFAFGMLNERALPATTSEEYFLSVWEGSHNLNPNLKLRSYTFYIPDKRGTFGTDWSIEPISLDR